MGRIIREVNMNGEMEDGFRLLDEKREYVTYPEESSFRIWYSDVPWTYADHYHSAVEIVLTLEGCVTYTVRGKKYEVRKDEILVVAPDVEHSLSMEEGSRRYLFLFEPEPVWNMRDARRLEGNLDRVFYLKEDSLAHDEIRDLLTEAVEIYEAGDMMWNMRCYSCAMRMFAAMAQNYLAEYAPKKIQAASADEEIIGGVMTYINNHYREEVTLDRVAAFAGFSRYYFSRTFRVKTGYSFKEYLSQKRVQVASDLLIHSAESIQDVARDSGFGSVATFNRIFRDYKKCTPSQYRAIYKDY